MEIKNGNELVAGMDQVSGLSRRRFFQLAGGITAAGLLLEACRRKSPPSDVFLGSGDQALLNCFYVIQQLEAAFYTQAVATPYYGMDASERKLLIDVRDQEIAHREYVKKLLGEKHVMDIAPNFSAVTFADRTSVMQNAAIIEDLSIACITGSAKYFSNKDYVFALGKMVSVEGRHSAFFRDMDVHNSFADSTAVDNYGLDVTDTPASVFKKAGAYIHTTFDASNLPN